MGGSPSAWRIRPPVGTILLLMLAIPAGSLDAQCRPADYEGRLFLEIVRRHADASVPSPSAQRDSLRRDQTPRRDVALITSPELCAGADSAYRRAANGDLSTLSGQVYVVRSGNDWFVWDSAYRYHSESPFVYMLFDAAWTLKRKFELD
jgi:hypothetical protein